MARSETGSPTRRKSWLLVGVSLFALWSILAAAWVCDDAYITFRTVDNALAGHGLRWNIAERVQTYTHPLWMLLVLGSTALLRDPYLASILLSLLCVGGAWTLLTRRIAASPEAGLLAVAVFTSSRSLVEYSTSGLENPLSFLLLIGLVALLRQEGQGSAVTLPCWWGLASLAMLTRHDLLMFFLPALLAVSLRGLRIQGLRRSAGQVLLGLSPFLAWTAWSVVYYGFPLPNTAYAKLGHGIARGALVRQGLGYLLHPLDYDWVGGVLLVLGLPVLLARGAREGRLLGAGVLLYLLYLVSIGGDYCYGRFLGMAMCAVLGGLAMLSWSRRSALLLGAAALLVGLAQPNAPALRQPSYHNPERNAWHLGDEAGAFFPQVNLRTYLAHRRITHEWATLGKAARARKEQVLVIGNIGFSGYYAGPSVHIIDVFGLGDPLLARLPALAKREWRVGHFQRVLPEGYTGAVLGEADLALSELQGYWEHLRRVTRGPLWDGERWRSILALNLGGVRLPEPERYRSPFLREVRQRDLPPPSPLRHYWADMRNVFVDEQGLVVNLEQPIAPLRLVVELGGLDYWQVEGWYARERRFSALIRPRQDPFLEPQVLDLLPEWQGPLDRLVFRAETRYYSPVLGALGLVSGE